jgi:hypothetical protein
MTNADGTPQDPNAPTGIPPVAQPRYGELAPVEPTPVVPQPVAPVAPPAAPDYQPFGAGTPAPPAAAPVYQAPPGYPAQPGYAAAPGYPAGPAPAQRKPRTADMVITIILLVVGLFVTLITCLTALALGQTAVDYWQMHGLVFHGQAGIPGDQAVLVISHLALLLIAAGISIPLLVKRRIAFWVPLAAGVIAAIFFWAVFAQLIYSDPAMLAALQTTSGE